LIEVKTYKPAVAGDDGMWLGTAQFYNNIAQSAFGQSTNYYHTFIRFPNIDIDNTLPIIGAKITFNCHLDNANTDCNALIYCQDSDNAVAPTNWSEADGLVLTSTYKEWNNIEGWTAGKNYDSVDFLNVLMSILNRPGWVSGKAIMVVIKNNGSTANALRWYHTITEGADYCPILSITRQYVQAEPIIATSSIELTSAEPTDWNVLIAPVTNITSSIGLQGVYEVSLTSYCYEEATKGIASDLVLKTKDGIGTDILNIFRRKNTKYLWYDADTNGQDLVVSFYVDGVLEDRTLTINNNGRIRNRLDLWNMEGYRFAIKLNAQDVMERGMKIYSPWNIIYDYAGV
jgi:hypothetical protein